MRHFLAGAVAEGIDLGVDVVLVPAPVADEEVELARLDVEPIDFP